MLFLLFLIACSEKKDYSFENSFSKKEENDPLNTSVNYNDDDIFNFKLSDELNNGDDDYYLANNVIRFGKN